KSFATFITFIRLLTSMNSSVNPEGRPLPKNLATFNTFVRLLSSMNPLMIPK
ncbi:hypothetical protein DBR06_SOUSAS11710059, partial [Sousa chinensis]